MAVSESLDAYSTVAGSNTPAGGDTVGPDLDDQLRDIKKNIRIVGENAQGPSSPTGFRGRLYLDTSGTASNKVTLNIYDGAAYRELFDIDTSAGTITPVIGSERVGTVGIELVSSESTASARSAIGLTTILEVGKQTLYVAAAAMRPSVTEGADPIQAVEIVSGRPNLQVIDFNDSATSRVQFSMAFPKSWDEGQLTFQPFGVSSITSANSCVFALRAVAVGHNDPYAGAYSNPVTTRLTATGTANDLLVGSESTSLSIAGTPAEADLVLFELYRDVANSGDTKTGDIRLSGTKILFTTNAGNDD